MTRRWYAACFTVAIVALTAGGIGAFRRIDALARTARSDTASMVWPLSAAPDTQVFLPIAASAAEYARYEAEDAAWRRRHARPFTLEELRARGDGRRTAQQQLQDRVYALTRRGEQRQAIAELERWVTRHPRDQDALLWLARLLNENGRSEAAIVRYRQLLEAGQGGSRE